ncbi:nucleotidyltransferase family protein [Vibrio ulleungensis]|uniref:nucleotidyltransferase family protein n=1 Tax=Vibrio ulleungensis TaxID=2807619 RepID=UPI001F3FE2C9
MVQQIIQWVKNDPLRCKALEGVFRLQLPECYIAAGFIRNLVWDHLHHVESSTPLNDIDVIYYDPENVSAEMEYHYERLLSHWMPDVNWQVRNQARMHAQNGDAPYTSSIDAMRYWPEIETAVAIRQLPHQQYECVSAFGFESLMSLQVTPNPKRDITVVEQRIVAKRWLSQWPKLRLNVTT